MLDTCGAHDPFNMSQSTHFCVHAPFKKPGTAAFLEIEKSWIWTFIWAVHIVLFAH